MTSTVTAHAAIRYLERILDMGFEVHAAKLHVERVDGCQPNQVEAKALSRIEREYGFKDMRSLLAKTPGLTEACLSGAVSFVSGGARFIIGQNGMVVTVKSTDMPHRPKLNRGAA